MINKKNNIKSMIELIIFNIDEFDSEFITYKAGEMKLLLQDILEYIENKEEEYEELRQYHNKCYEENTEKLKQWLEKYNQLSRGFYNGKYCNEENCNLLKAKEEECEELKDKKQYLINTYCHFKNEIKKYKKAVHKYKVILQDKIERLHLSRREFLEEINSVPVKIAYKSEILKNALNNFNNAIQAINNEDRYKQALDRIEKDIKDYCKNMCMAETKETCESCQNTEILNIINKAKEDK